MYLDVLRVKLRSRIADDTILIGQIQCYQSREEILNFHRMPNMASEVIDFLCFLLAEVEAYLMILSNHGVNWETKNYGWSQENTDNSSYNANFAKNRTRRGGKMINLAIYVKTQKYPKNFPLRLISSFTGDHKSRLMPNNAMAGHIYKC